MSLRIRFFLAFLIPLGFVIIGCQGVGGPSSKPIVIITSPPSGSTFEQGEEVLIQSTATDPAGIVKIELLVDGIVARVDPSPVAQGQAQFSVVQSWVAEAAGSHTLTVRAFNAQNVSTESGIVLTIRERSIVEPTSFIGMMTPVPLATGTRRPTLAATAKPATASAPSPAPNTAEPPACTYNSAFVADVTIPDGTIFTPGAIFTKTWRVRNTGTCPWDNSFALVFISGAQMSASGIYPVPPTQAGATADLTVPMSAPTSYGAYQGTWRMRDPAGKFFGASLTVVISVPAPATSVPPTNTLAPTSPPTGCSGKPNDFTFSASATSITAGQTVTLSWGAITNASSATLDGEGIPSPGSRNVNPTLTTTYTIVAVCANSGQSRAKSVTITVNAGGPTVRFDFIARAPEAQWCGAPPGGACTILGFNGSTSDPNGFAVWREGLPLENNIVPPGRVLETHPMWVDDGIISGLFPEYTVQNGDRFRSQFGFLKGGNAGNVKLQLNYREGSVLKPLGSWSKAYDGSLINLNIDLSALAGKTVRFALVVLANGSAGQDWAVWVRPRIER